MGKYIRKRKIGVVVMDVSESSMGVRTRARTLALEQQNRKNSALQLKEQQVNVLNFCYLELRSRKLEKVFGCCEKQDDAKKQKTSAAAHLAEITNSKRQRGSSPQLPHPSKSDTIGVVSVAPAISRSNSFSSKPQQQQHSVKSTSRREQLLAEGAAQEAENNCPAEGLELRTAEVEVSCGDNVFDHDGQSSRDSFGAEYCRRLRESTPICNDYELPVDAPGSSSRVQSHRVHAQRTGNAVRQFDVPSLEEIERFFADKEEVDQKSLSDRYNYDFVNDVPLPGRFEWTTSL